MAKPSYRYDFFIAHASADLRAAEQLFELLAPHATVFLDSRSLRLGDDWDIAIPEAQTAARVSVILASNNSGSAYYAREEVRAAIALSRFDSQRHRVVPVFLDSGAAAQSEQHYGLRLKHGITLRSPSDLANAAARLIDLITQLRAEERTRASASEDQVKGPEPADSGATDKTD